MTRRSLALAIPALVWLAAKVLDRLGFGVRHVTAERDRHSCLTSKAPIPDAVIRNGGWCILCGDQIADVSQLLDHVRLMHPDDYGSGPQRWPDGGLVVHDVDPDPLDYEN